MYLHLVSSTLTSNDDKGHPTLDVHPHFTPAENKGDGSINKVNVSFLKNHALNIYYVFKAAVNLWPCETTIVPSFHHQKHEEDTSLFFNLK